MSLINNACRYVESRQVAKAVELDNTLMRGRNAFKWFYGQTLPIYAGPSGSRLLGESPNDHAFRILLIPRDTSPQPYHHRKKESLIGILWNEVDRLYRSLDPTYPS